MKLTQFRWLAAAAVGSMFAVGCVVTTGGPVEPVNGGSRVTGPSRTKTTQPAQATPATPPATPAATTGPTVTGIAPPVAQTVAPTTPTPTTAPPPATPPPPAGTTGGLARPPGIAPIPANTAPPPGSPPPADTTGGKKIAVPTATSTAKIAIPGKKLRRRGAAQAPALGTAPAAAHGPPPAPPFPPLSRSTTRTSSPSSQYPAISSDQPEGVQVRNTSH